MYIQYCHTSQKRTLLTTGIEIPKESWDINRTRIKDGLPQNLGDSSQLNKSMREMVTIVKEHVSIGQNNNFDPISFLKKSFVPEMLNTGIDRK